MGIFKFGIFLSVVFVVRIINWILLSGYLFPLRELYTIWSFFRILFPKFQKKMSFLIFLSGRIMDTHYDLSNFGRGK